MRHYVGCSIIYGSQDMDATYVPISRWKDKDDVVYVYSGVLLSHPKNEILSLVKTWMDLEGIVLSEISQTREKQTLYAFAYMWNLKSKRTSISKQKQGHIYRE